MKKSLGFSRFICNGFGMLFLLMITGYAGLCQTTKSYNYQKAVDAYEAKDYDLAIDYFGREIKDNPKNSDAYFYRAIVYQEKENYSYALSDINLALKNYGSKEKVSLSAAHALKAKLYVAIDDTAAALEEYAMAIKLRPEDVGTLMDRAAFYYNLSKFDQAAEDCKKAVKIDESSSYGWVSLGRIYIAKKQLDEAEKVLNKVVKLSPDYQSGYYYRAVMYYDMKKYNEAISDAFYGLCLDDKDKFTRNLFLKYAKKNHILALSKINAKMIAAPDNDMLYFARAQMFENNLEYLDAIADYTKLIELTDARYKSDVLYYRASCYKEAGIYDMAINDYSESILLDSTSSYSYGYRGDTKRLQGDYKGAVADLTAAIKLNPTEDFFYYRRGWVKDEFLNDTEGGLKDYDQSISINSDNAYTYLHRGRLYLEKLKNPKKANDDFNAMLTKDTVVSEDGNCRQYALFHLGKNDEAIKWQKDILEKFPTGGNYYDAACLYSLMNKTDESLASLSLSFENGFRKFVHIQKDDDLNNLRVLPGFKMLYDKWKKISDESLKLTEVDHSAVPSTKLETAVIPMKAKGSGIYEVSCKVNDLRLNFIFDTGASDISISQTEALFMLKNGYLNESDMRGKQHFMDANGDISVGTQIMLKKVELGGLFLKNITASVVDNKNAPLLFGQSALSKYGKIEIDNKKSQITISVVSEK